MSLSRLQITDFRCLRSASFELDSHFTLISGPNASGKTSLLEAVYILGRGRSFRSRQVERLIRRGSERFVVYGEVDVGTRSVRLGIEGSSVGLSARIGGQQATSMAELALTLPVQIIDPEIHRLIEDGPSQKRRFLDWGVFHVEHEFVGYWQRYQQSLRQRNAALKLGNVKEIAAWNADLVRYGNLVSDARARYVQSLSSHCRPICQKLMGQDLALAYRPGWSGESTFADSLAASLTQDREKGITHVGPHRADLNIRLDGMPVKDRISRGQQKLLAAALLIGQLGMFPDVATIRPTLLLDDPAAELDDDRLARLIQEVACRAGQLIVTTLHEEFSAFGVPGQRFAVRDGVLEAR